MEWKYILYKKQEMESDSVVSEELQRIFEQAKSHGIDVEAVLEDSFLTYMQRHGILPEEALVVTATDESLKEISAFLIANIGYKQGRFPREELYQADILVEGWGEVDFYFLERIYQRKHGIPWRVIETKRCYLREMTLADLDELYEMYEEPSITEYMEPLYEREQEEEYTKAYIANMYRFYGYGMWLIRDRYNDTLIGRAGLNNLELDGESMLEMGYAIKVSYQRKRYAYEVCEAIIDYAKYAGLGYDRLYCFVREGNRASIALLECLEFQFIGRRWREGRNLLVYELIF